MPLSLGLPSPPLFQKVPTGPGSPSRPSLPSLPCCCTSKGTLPHSGEVVFTVGGATVESALLSALGSTVASQKDNKEWHNHKYTFVVLNFKLRESTGTICIMPIDLESSLV